MYLIKGKERKQLKKRLAMLKQFVKTYWIYNDLETVYGGGLDKKESEQLLNKKRNEIKEIETMIQKEI